MPIQVTCPGCLKRFSVADKFAGQKGPCPKCKEIITIPKKEDEIVIHAPEHSEVGAVGVGGRNVLKTYRRRDTKFQPLVFTSVIGFVLVSILVALVIRSVGAPEVWLKTLAAVVLGPPIAWAGYTFLRDPELEAYQGMPLAVRSVACGLVFALLWGIYWFIAYKWGGTEAFTKGMPIFQLVLLSIIVVGIGTFAAFASFDLEPGSAFFLCAMYFALTVVLRLIAHLPALPGLGHA
ncbi:MAG TPA: hypothetical protein VH107_11615 [Lacipirellulaceae bacterium]|jgi:hypothetical protein|nr:hypothetical protein [Lacipirellulaceae bacterium]